MAAWPTGLLRAAAAAAHATTFYLTIAGLGGEPDYEQRFKMWADDIDGSLKKAGGDANVITLPAPTPRADPRAASPRLAKQAKPDDALVLMLIGHGTFDGADYKFNLPGPDLTGAELASLLDHVPATRQLVVNMTSASGGSIESLRKPNRVVITATKTGTEKNATVFARYWVEALRDPAADTDKNETISRSKLPLRADARPPSSTRRRSAWPPSTRCSKTPARAKANATSHRREWRRHAGRHVSRGAPGRQCRRRARSREADAARQEGTARTGDRQAEIREGRDARRTSTRSSSPQLLLELAKTRRRSTKVRAKPVNMLQRLWRRRACCSASALALSGADAATGRSPLESAPLSRTPTTSSSAGRRSIPRTPDYRVRWGRLSPGACTARPTRQRPVQGSAGDQEGPRRRAARPGADRRRRFRGARRRAGAARRSRADPKLVEAQELLARLALEDNNNSKATEEADKALAIDPNSVHAMAILATIDWLADKKETAVGSARPPRATRPPAISS